MFISKSSILSFSLRLLFLIFGIFIKVLFFSDNLLLESDTLVDSNDQDINKDQSLKNKIKNLP
jgi:hypothetical protein